MSAEQRSETIKESNRCFNCLNGNHRVHECRSRARCQKCFRKHHTSLHGTSGDVNTTKSDHLAGAQVHEAILSTFGETDQATNTSQVQTLSAKQAIAQTILPTALVKIKDVYGRFHTYRALLDSGSQASFVSEACIHELKLNRVNNRILVKGLGEAKMGTTRGSVEITIASMDGIPVVATQALIIPKVSEIHSQFNLSEADLQILKELKIADPEFNKRGHVEVLLGADVFFKALRSDRSLNLPSGLTAVRTIFGWVVAGGTTGNEPTANNFNLLLDIDKSLRQFWEIEELPITVTETPEDQKCEKIFQSTTKHGKGNKFIVKLPFKQNENLIGTTYNAAINRLKSMEKRFERDEEFAKLYKAFMMEYEQLGHMQKMHFCKRSINSYYLPHHGVLKASSESTKLRVVFDASAKSSTGLSLNDMLMVGPTIQPPLIEILLRFRQHEFVVCGDIEKMYRQVWVDEEDLQYQNILWRPNPNQQPVAYQLKTLTYGTASAAFLATRCLKEVGVKLQSIEPKAARVILNDMYVDDMMTGASSITEAKNLITNIKRALANNGFPLRKFITNNMELQSFLQIEMGETIKEIGEHTETPKILGLHWDTYEDAFKFSVQLPERSVHTKRTILSDASRSFDPLGWLNPIIIRVKMLFQSLWMQNLTWDGELPADILASWLAIRGDISNTTKIKIPRWLQTTKQVTLIGFSDASEYAYAAVIYAVVDTSDGFRSILVMAKSRVAPIKQISLPRLELMGALLLANLMKVVEGSLNIAITKILLFTDSRIVLDWLSAHPRRWTTFVANRVSEIVQNYKREYWCHVKSKDNPADIASRGTTVSELAQNKLWWHGPYWLTDEEQLKRVQLECVHEGEATKEELRTPKVDAFIASTNSEMDNFISRYSSFHKMAKVLALIRRYINNLKPNRHALEKTSCREEILAAEMSIIRYIQQSDFSTELDALRNNRPLPRQSNLITLNPFLDDKGVIRVGGRIQKSYASFNTKHPIILPMKHHAVKCLVRDTHMLHNHPGVSLLTSIVRRTYWIIKAKVLSRAVVHRCIKCIKHNPKLGSQIMGNLPAERVQFNHPFHNIGVDYCGPFKVQPTRRRGQIPMKVYVCIFVCLSTKAVHIETVCDLTTEAFLGALTRLTSRRGSCHTIYSDNATNFVGANNQLKELLQFLRSKASDIASALLKYKIEWKFIPPGTPHMGGIWEAAVKQAKIHLGRVVGDTILTLEEFTTLLTKIEAIMNSRPLAASQAEDVDCLTPAHFLIGRAYTDIADENVENESISPKARWRMVKQMQQRFWSRWHQDYLTVLQKRNKWITKSNNLAIDDIVLISESNSPSTCWALGKVVKTHPGSDGKVRVVDIRIANSTKIIQRPIHKLCKLPINESGDSWPAEC